VKYLSLKLPELDTTGFSKNKILHSGSTLCTRFANGAVQHPVKCQTYYHIEDGAFKLFKCTFPGFNL